MYAKYPHPEPIERAVKLIMSRQLPVCSPTTPCVLRFGAHGFVVFAGRFVGARSDRGDVQSDGRHFMPGFQALVHDLDAGQGRQLFEAAEGREGDKRVRSWTLDTQLTPIHIQVPRHVGYTKY
jgi:hypothetical protein